MARFTRRAFLEAGAGAAAALFAHNVAASVDPRKRGKACILLWMDGGQSHVDTWDPKPDACKAIRTRAPGVRVCEHLPAMADIADRITIVRGMKATEGDHQRARSVMRGGMSVSLAAGLSLRSSDVSIHIPLGMRVGATPTDRRAFDLSDEPAATRASYGDTTFGRGCLVARRLVEAGSRYVEVTLGDWDAHQDNSARTASLLAILDPAMAALIRDLEERNLLESTLVLSLGEFGRTPRVNPAGGRDHWPYAFSAVLAGCGMHGGTVHGQTDATGAEVVADRMCPASLFAFAARLLRVHSIVA
jgi:uncharacterized protein (DUF1501 family)